MKPKDFEPDDGYWIFDDQKLYLLNGSMMNRSWLIVTELMKKREDLTDDFLWPFRKKLERALSIPQVVMDLVKEEQRSPMDLMLEKNGIRRLRDGEEEQKN